MRCLWLLLFFLPVVTPSKGEDTSPLDLRLLARQSRPAVYLIAILDEDGKTIGCGTGFLVSADGWLITNAHVIKGAKTMVAKAENGGLFPIRKVLATDSPNDLAVLELDGQNLPHLTLSTSGGCEAGSRIAVIGSPLGLQGTLSEGIVSARRNFPGQKREVLQISAPISPGSSGSPVLDSKGKVVGIASFLLTEGQSLYFATPSEKLQALLARLGRPAPVSPPLSSPTRDSSPTYTVRSGDTLHRITRELKSRGIETTPEELRNLNQLSTNAVIRPGQVLKVP